MDILTASLIVVKFSALILGGIVSGMAYKAYRQTQMEGLQYFAAGLAVITIGTFFVGFFHHIVGISTIAGMLVESLIICAGFVIMIFGLY